MADVLVIYQGGDPTWRDKPAAEIEARLRAWGEWFKPLEATGKTIGRMRR